jgi:hypothetical protein
MLPIPTKIRAIRDDPADPQMDLYAKTDVASLAALAVSKAFSNLPTPTKKDSKMAGVNYTGVVGLEERPFKSASKRHVFGISANDNAQAIIGTLHRLGLVGNDIVAPLKQIAAAGKPLGGLFQVSLYDVDRALSDVDATAGDKIGFKASLRNANLLKQ